MALSNPIEVVVIRDLALRPRPEPDEGPSELPPTPGREERDVDELMGLLLCSKRRGVLCILASRAARGERTSVGEIARRLGLSQKNLSQHLAPLRTSGLIYATRRGQCREYEITPGRVVYQRHGDGQFSLTVTARGGGVAVTITVGGSGPAVSPPNP